MYQEAVRPRRSLECCDEQDVNEGFVDWKQQLLIEKAWLATIKALSSSLWKYEAFAMYHCGQKAGNLSFPTLQVL